LQRRVVRIPGNWLLLNSTGLAMFRLFIWPALRDAAVPGDVPVAVEI
jgi:hypothetical protein